MRHNDVNRKEVRVYTQQELDVMDFKRNKFRKSRESNSKYFEDLLILDNVISVGVGLKTIKGFVTDTPCLVVTVCKKMDVSKENMVPKEVGGIPTDVIVGDIPEAFSNPRTLYRPAPGGVSMGVELGNATGTLGCCVFQNSNNAPLGLTNAHVLAYNTGMAYDGSRCNTYNWVQQPSRFDAKFPAYNPMGYMNGYSVIGAMGSDVDASCITCAYLAPNTILDITLPYGLTFQEDNVFPNDPVIKSGRTTNVTTGTITEIDVGSLINYRNCDGTSMPRYMSSQIKTSPMLSPGDSGSILLHNNYGKEIAGLCFAGGSTSSLANMFGRVMGRLAVHV